MQAEDSDTPCSSTGSIASSCSSTGSTATSMQDKAARSAARIAGYSCPADADWRVCPCARECRCAQVVPLLRESRDGPALEPWLYGLLEADVDFRVCPCARECLCVEAENSSSTGSTAASCTSKGSTAASTGDKVSTKQLEAKHKRQRDHKREGILLRKRQLGIAENEAFALREELREIRMEKDSYLLQLLKLQKQEERRAAEKQALQQLLARHQRQERSLRAELQLLHRHCSKVQAENHKLNGQLEEVLNPSCWVGTLEGGCDLQKELDQAKVETKMWSEKFEEVRKFLAELNKELASSCMDPISMQPMHDPVLAADLHTYDRESIEAWHKVNPTSPHTRAPLQIATLRSNKAAKWLAEASAKVAEACPKFWPTEEPVSTVTATLVLIPSQQKMAMEEPLITTNYTASLYYGSAEHEAELREKYGEILKLRELAPDAAGAAQPAGQAAGILTVQSQPDGKSAKGKRAFPTPNKPEPMPEELAFLFTKISPEQMMYMWNIYTLLFFSQCGAVVAYCLMLANGVNWYLATAIFGVPFMALMIQNVYILHDVLHGATFPPYSWQTYITHPFADQFSLPWEDVVLEHQRHHASTVDLLIHGEFGWDPAGWLYVLQEWTQEWYGWLTVPLVPLWHWVGANDTGAIFAMLWFSSFPESAAGGKCNKDFYRKWVPRRFKHALFVATLWTCVWLLGTFPLGRPLSEGWRFFLTVTFFARTGFTTAWVVFTNFNHSHWWNHFLAENPGRSFPMLHRAMALVLGGRHRFNEMLFHDLHHAFPNAVGALSQRGRFHGWAKVHDAACEVLSRGLFLPQSDDNEEPPMQKIQERRSVNMTSTATYIRVN